MAIWAVGDVQGCRAELEQLLGLIHFDRRRDQLWLCGDLVNRGPDSLGTLRLVRDLGDPAKVVLGNHDLHLLAVAADVGHSLRAGDTLETLLEAPDRSLLLEWLATRPLVHHDARIGWTMVHAGLPPQWTPREAVARSETVTQAITRDPRAFFADMYGNDPDRWRSDLTADEQLRYTVNCMTRMRILAADGRVLLKFKDGLKDLPKGAVPWFRVAGRRSAESRIVFGHWSTLGYYEGDGVLCLDTGCAWGNALTARRLDDPAAPPVVVPAIRRRGALLT
jgi:bis(5'-nucleosyl)-tetraphosphatase (symmetrical)